VQASLPYRLGGISSEKIPMNHQMISEQFKSSFLKPSAANGFIKAYEELTSAIAEEDDEFVRQVCEPALADHLLSAMTDIKKKGLRLVKAVPASGNRVFNLNYNKVSIHAFQPFERSKQDKTMSLKTPAVEMFVNFVGATKGLDYRTLAFITFVVEIDTNVQLKLVSRTPAQETEVPNRFDALQTHRIEFAIPKDDFLKGRNIMSLLSLQMKNQPPGEMWGDMFASGSYQWYIYDMDDFMRSK
jgi:hypothetical protein